MLAQRFQYKGLCWQIGKNGVVKADASNIHTGTMQHPASLTWIFNSLFHITAWYSAIQGMHRLQLYFTTRFSHLPEANSCKLSLAPSLSSLHMEAWRRPTSRAQIRAKFNIHLDATSELSSDIAPLHSHIHSIECNAPAMHLHSRYLKRKFEAAIQQI